MENPTPVPTRCSSRNPFVLISVRDQRPVGARLRLLALGDHLPPIPVLDPDPTLARPRKTPIKPAGVVRFYKTAHRPGGGVSAPDPLRDRPRRTPIEPESAVRAYKIAHYPDGGVSIPDHLRLLHRVRFRRRCAVVPPITTSGPLPRIEGGFVQIRASRIRVGMSRALQGTIIGQRILLAVASLSRCLFDLRDDHGGANVLAKTMLMTIEIIVRGALPVLP